MEGTAFDTNTLLKSLLRTRDAGMKDSQQAEKDLKESFGREDAARAAKSAALDPLQNKLEQKMAAGPAVPTPAPTPQAPKSPVPFNPQETQGMLALVTALAVFGGAFTRKPLTAALNNFTAGVTGFVQGKQKVYDNALKEFKSNLEEARSKNEQIWREYVAAKDKHGTDIRALQQEMQIIAARYEAPIDAELAKQGRIGDLLKLHEKQNEMWTKTDAALLRFKASTDEHAATRADAEKRLNETKRHHEATEKKGAEGGEAPAKMLKEFTDEKRKIDERFRKEMNKASGDTKATLEQQHKEAIAQLVGQFNARGLHLPAEGAGAAPAPASTPATRPAQPLPEKKDQLVKDTIYKTTRGDARWDGEKFIPIT